MRNRVGLTVLTVAMFVGACGGGQTTQPNDPNSTSTITGLTPSTSTSTTANESTSDDPETVSAYLVEITNLIADLDEQQMRFQEDYDSEFWGARDPDEEPTQEEAEAIAFEHVQGFWIGSVGVTLDHLDALAAIDPPSRFVDSHEQYVASSRALWEDFVGQISAMAAPSELDEFMQAIFDPSIPMPTGFDELNAEYLAACESLQQLGRDSGFEFDLGCPAPPSEGAEAITVEAEVGGPWQAVPLRIPAENPVVELRMTNVGDEPIQLLVIVIFEGDVANLPIVDGRLDLTRAGVVSDPESDFTTFGVIYPGIHGGEDDPNPVVPVLAPGETIAETMQPGGSIVILDYRQGEFEAGSYIVIETLN